MYFLVFHCIRLVSFFFFKQKTAYEMRISDWSSDVCSSDLGRIALKSADPRDHPAIHPNYLATETDRRVTVAGMKITRQIVGAEPLAAVVEEEMTTGENGRAHV